MDVSFHHPFTAIVRGPTGCGKTSFVKRFILDLDKMCDVVFAEIIWCYDERQPWFDSFPYAVFQEGLPQLQFTDGAPRLVIIDDLMRESDDSVVDLFTKKSHHRNLSVFYLTQNFFHQSKGQRDISLNTHYIIFFKNPRDKTQITHLAKQIYPENVKFIREIYNDATAEPFQYLLIDLKQSTPDEYRFRSRLFPKDQRHYVYVPRTFNFRTKPL